MNTVVRLKPGKCNPGIITLNSGTEFDLMNPEQDKIFIGDIAWGLSKQIRYNGHIPYDYTVARHSVILSYYVPEEYAMEALLHDAGEAYVGDMVTPLKAVCPQFEEIEDRITGQIMLKFNDGWMVEDGMYTKSELVDEADYEIYLHECTFLDRKSVGRYIPKMQGATTRAMNGCGLGNLKVTGKEGDNDAFLARFYELSERETV